MTFPPQLIPIIEGLLYYPGIVLEALCQTKKNCSQEISYYQQGIRNEVLPHTRQRCYRYANLLYAPIPDCDYEEECKKKKCKP
jgi:hypothetical protein